MKSSVCARDELSGDTLNLVKKRKHEGNSAQVTQELDILAALQSRDPSVDQIGEVYRESATSRTV